MTGRIAIVGIALRYPDADTPEQLWENVLAGRRAFRALPDERMRRDDYWSPDPAEPDRFYTAKAAVLRGFDFDRRGYKVAGSTFRATDMTHWLALDTAARALADAGFPAGEGLPRQATGVVVGNSLTGEFSRALMMRLRWPYVRRMVGTALLESGYDPGELAGFLAELEERYKEPFPPVDEDTLAGGLSNTISGRICNFFDLNGGGYTVDGACSSSLLSVATACKALTDGDLDVAIAGGVDLSIDPFEVIGFAKTGALAKNEMRVYDQHSNGFWPGEGCGMLVLMREADAAERESTPYGYVAGWGIASDGKGGMTRPEASGHALALRRAYERAGYGTDTVAYYEGHGTGTAVGDATELEALALARRTANPDAEPAALSTIKGNIGHTKAAAGVVGLIKATLALHHQVIPPATSHLDPHEALTGDRPLLRVPLAAEAWPADKPLRAGVSSMGFGGINTHIVLEGAATERVAELDETTRALVASRQDAELLLLDGPSLGALRAQASELAELAPRLSYAELGDVAATCYRELTGGPMRAAVVATDPEQAARRCAKLVELLDSGARSVLSASEGIFVGRAGDAARIAYLFPGQGSGTGGGGALRRRFAEVDEVYRAADLPAGGDQVATEVAQPRIVTGSLAGLRALDLLGIEGSVAAGHSLGELTALHWAGAMDAPAVLALAAERGRVMASASEGGGAMASIAATPEDVEPLIAGGPVVIAGYNGPEQTVVSGPAADVDRVIAAAAEQGLTGTRINVSHAFHSPLVEPAATGLADYVSGQSYGSPRRRMVSTVTGTDVPPDVDITGLLRDQVLKPVLFAQAAAAAAADADLVVEVGPGRVLTGLAGQIAPHVPVIALDTDGPSLAGLLQVAGAAWVLGTPVALDKLFDGRPWRPFPLDTELTFLANPCESAPVLDLDDPPAPRPRRDRRGNGSAPVEQPAEPGNGQVTNGQSGGGGKDTLQLLRELAAERVELPVAEVTPDTHPLDDLHLSSITVGQIVNQVTKELGRPPLAANSSLATATLEDLAQTIDGLDDTAHDGEGEQPAEAAGIAPWVRSFTLDLVEAAAPAADTGESGDWQVFAPDGHQLAEPLRAALAAGGVGSGVLLCLPADCDEDQVELMLAAGQAALAADRFAVVQHGRGASGLAKTLHLEAPAVATTLVDLAGLGNGLDIDAAVAAITADVAATTGFSEVHYDGELTRRVPVFRALPPHPAGDPAPGDLPLGDGDVLLVTGGGKGITAECALALARDTGAAVALLGRSDPATDAELGENLERMETAGVRHVYVRADVTDAGAVRAAVDEVREKLGPVTALLHGAGRNEPAGLAGLDAEAFQATLAPKITGLRTVLDAVDPGTLKLLVSFGSIIGRAGLRGEAHYATANDWLTHLTVEVGAKHPDCRAVSLEWSVWSGAGMGERLGVVEALVRDGITPIPPEAGIAVLRQVLSDVDTGSVVLVTGRAAGLPTLPLETRELPLLRFTEQPVVHYPRIELICDAELSAATDPYLADHLLDGDLLFPAVLGMEAMAQVAGAVSGHDGTPVLEGAEFLRPIAAPPDGSTTIRVAALVRDEACVDAVIRSAETGYGADHFRATFRYGDTGAPPPAGDEESAAKQAALEPVPVDPAGELYGSLLFQGERFQRLGAYRRMLARECVADIGNQTPAPWFAEYLPQRLTLADPGTRDAMMHSIQCCVPNAVLLPASLDRLWLADPDTAGGLDQVVLHAYERSQDGDRYVYDVDVRGPDNTLLERWEGLHLQAVRKRDGAGPWTAPLLGPFLTRELEQILGAPGLAVQVWPEPGGDTEQRRQRTAAAVARQAGRDVPLRHRPDGKPEVPCELQVSASHGAGVTLAVAAETEIACDVEAVSECDGARCDELLWPELRELREVLTRESDEDSDTVATRLWTVVECIRKSGGVQQPVTAEPGGGDGWAVFAVGDRTVATFLTRLRGLDSPAVFAVMTEGRR
jgi:enediyne polyketide synthase